MNGDRAEDWKKLTMRKVKAAAKAGVIPRPESLATLVHAVRGEKVLLDADLGALYGVETRALNQAVRRNLGRFPDDFMFQLTQEEWDRLRSQNVTSKGGAQAMRSQSVTALSGGNPDSSQTVILKREGVATLKNQIVASRIS